MVDSSNTQISCCRTVRQQLICENTVVEWKLERPQSTRADHFSNIVADRAFSTVSNSCLLFYTKRVTTPSKPRPLPSPTTLWF